MIELVFHHGWGFTADFWNPLRALLPGYKSHAPDRGYFDSGKARAPETFSTDSRSILVGHSFGFLRALLQRTTWDGWIAINGFSHFLTSAARPGCVASAELQALGLAVKKNPQAALTAFHKRFGDRKPQGEPQQQLLGEDLDQLSVTDIAPRLEGLSAPGLILASSNDPLVSLEVTQRLHTSAATAPCYLHPSGGHLLPQTDPAWCALHIKSFLKNGWSS